MKLSKKSLSILLIVALVTTMVFSQLAFAVGEGPLYKGNETINNSRITTYDEMVELLKDYDEKSDLISLQVFGQTVKGRDLYLVKFGDMNPNKPTVLFLTQQHGNEVLSTEAALDVIKNLSANSKNSKDLARKINVLFIPKYNADGGEADVNFPLENYYGGGLATRYNANRIDLNRDHTDRTQPETQALHNEVLSKYKIDYMIDFHHQGTTSAVDGEYVSGSILYPTNEGVKPEVVQASRKLGAIVYNAVESRGFGKLGKYIGGSANTIARNCVAHDYGIPTLLFEMRGMIDNEWMDAVLGQKSNGYLIQQSVVTMQAVMNALATGEIETVDDSFWETLTEQGYKVTE